jgi:exopolysaccharide production protein ExoY
MLRTFDTEGPDAPFALTQPISVPAFWNPAIQAPDRSRVIKAHRASRVLDVVVATLALIFFGPLMIVIAVLVKMSGGPVLFGHQRLGRGGQVFTCYKFRTMYPDAGRLLAELLERDPAARIEWDRDHKLKTDPRVSRVGALLRKSSLDELPQLFNVLGGTMSIVGPRPIVQAEAFRYGRHFSVYCQVRPGITGLWQVSGRNSTTYRRRVACDVAYVRTKAPLNDLRIIARTIPAVCFGRGAY